VIQFYICVVLVSWRYRWSGRSFLLEALRIQLYSWDYTRNILETR